MFHTNPVSKTQVDSLLTDLDFKAEYQHTDPSTGSRHRCYDNSSAWPERQVVATSNSLRCISLHTVSTDSDAAQEFRWSGRGRCTESIRLCSDCCQITSSRKLNSMWSHIIFTSNSELRNDFHQVPQLEKKKVEALILFGERGNLEFRWCLFVFLFSFLFYLVCLCLHLSAASWWGCRVGRVKIRRTHLFLRQMTDDQDYF